MHQPPPISFVRDVNGKAVYRQGLEQVLPNGQYNDKRLEKLLGRRLRTSYQVPGQENDKIRLLLEKLAAKLRETAPD